MIEFPTIAAVGATIGRPIAMVKIKRLRACIARPYDGPVRRPNKSILSNI